MYMKMMEKLRLLLILLLFIIPTFSYTSLSINNDGLLPNGDFEKGPKPSELKGSVVTSPNAIPKWTISGFVEYIKSGQKQGDMVLVVSQGYYAVRLGNDASIKQKIKLIKGTFYSLTLSAARTCAQDENLNVSVVPNDDEKNDWGVFSIQTMYGSNGWDSYACGFRSDHDGEYEIVIHNTGTNEDPACGPLIDSVALKVLNSTRRTKDNLLKNGNFEEGPYIFPKSSWGVLIPPHIDDSHSPLPGWIIESLKAVKFIDSDHFFVPNGKRAIELVAGKESSIAQNVITAIGKVYDLTFSVGDANNSCQGSMVVEAFTGRDTVQVPYQSKGKGGFIRGKLRFMAVTNRTRIRFLSTFYTLKNDNSGSLCGPVIDDIKLLNVHYPRHAL